MKLLQRKLLCKDELIDAYDVLVELDPLYHAGKNEHDEESEFSGTDGYVSTYDITDIKLSKLFAMLYEDALLYVPDTKKWMFYNGIQWSVDDDATMVQRCMDIFIRALGMYIAQSAWMTTEEKMANSKAISRYQSQMRRATLIKDCQDEQKLVKYRKDFDADDTLFNCPSVTIRLAESPEIIEHNPKHYITKCAGCNPKYENGQYVFYVVPDTSEWMMFLNQIMENNSDKVGYLQRIFGYGMSASTIEDKLFILYGKTTRNGKSTLLNTIAKALGDYATTAKPELLQVTKRDAGRATPELAKLDGVRTLILSEPPENMILDVALAKTLTGGDSIAVRHLNEEEFNLKPKFKAFINTNHELRVLDETLFSSNRVQVIEFNRHFDEAEQDKHLEDKLSNCLQDVLMWCLIGYSNYILHDSLVPPDDVVNANKAYRDSMSKIGLFMEDCLTKVEGESAGRVGVPLSDMFKTYKAWCTEQGYGVENKGKFRTRFINSDKCSIISEMKINGVPKRDVLIGYQLRELNYNGGD